MGIKHQEIQRPRNMWWFAGLWLGALALCLWAYSAFALDFEPCVQYPVTGNTCSDAPIADLNGDEAPDFVTVGGYYQPGTITTFLGAGYGYFSGLAPFTAGNSSTHLAIDHFNSDPHPDLAVANRFGSNVSVFLGNGDGTFTPANPPTFPAGNQSINVSAGSLNGDEYIDLVAVNHGNSNVQIMLGNGDGTFTEKVRIPVSSGPNSCDIADVNNDDLNDLVVPGWWGYSISILIGNGDGTFAEVKDGGGNPIRPAIGRRCWDLVVADLDEDGKLDIVAANTIDNTLSVLMGNGDGTFQPQVVYPIGFQAYGIAAIDMDRDGFVDIVASGAGNLWVYPGNGTGVLGSGWSFACSNGGGSVEVADLNGDRLEDAVIAWGNTPAAMVKLQRNAPPEILCPAPQVLTCAASPGVDADIALEVSDENNHALTLEWWVDEVLEQTDGLAEFDTMENTTVTFSGTFVAGNHNIVVMVDDEFADPVMCSTTVTVNDTTPPEISDTAINPVEIGTNVTITAIVDDTAMCGSAIQSAEYSLNGGAWAPMGAVDTSFDESHEDVTATFSAPEIPGIYDLCMRGTDTGSNSTSACSYLAVYDPDGGFATGGGWIDSPIGAYRPDPLLTGKANFGFVSKYKKGASTPTGQTEFNFKVAALNFHSDSYDWLVVAGAKAMYKGVGTINGSGHYGFMLKAIDAEQTPSIDVDLFRIKIWDKNNADTIVYDNEMGVGEDIEPTTAIGGGNIKVHNGK